MSVTSYKTAKGKKRWRARVWDAQRGTSGGYVHLGNRDTKRDAQALVDEYRERTRLPAATETTVNQWRDLWLTTSPVGESTKVWHRERTANFAKTHGHQRIGQIPRTLAMEWADRAPSEAQALSAMWAAAIRARIVHDHIWDGLIVRGSRTLEPGWLTSDDIAGLIEAARIVHPGPHGALVAAMVTVGAYVGLRPGELAGLRWGDLDPADGLIHVRRQANSTLQKMTPPKGGRPRTVVYPDIARHAVEQVAPMDGADGLVFVSKRGSVLYAANRNTIWKPVRSWARRPTMVMHELRHFAATWLLEQGVSDSDVAVQLGHTDGGRLVRSTYGHPRADPALQRVRAALQGAGPDTHQTPQGRTASSEGK